jgi:hypothetical protein
MRIDLKLEPWTADAEVLHVAHLLLMIEAVGARSDTPT